MATTTSKSKPTTSKSKTAKSPKTPAKSASATAATKPMPKTEPAKKPVATTAANPKLVGAADPALTQADLRKKELIDLVVARSGIKKKDAKPVVEAMLSVLGETVASGREFNLQPLGKLRINRSLDKANGRVFICKLRQSSATNAPGADPLAEAMSKL